jgi:protein-S-isoprenylcysteine O-methyltransferase Ste14
MAAVASGLAWPHQWQSAPVALWCGWLLLLIAALCGIGGAVALGRNLSPFPQPSPEARLIQKGIYGLIRHPLYTALMCGAVGWALVRESWPALGTALVLIPFLGAKARVEEQWLRRQFPEYAEYERRVGRFLPRL